MMGPVYSTVWFLILEDKSNLVWASIAAAFVIGTDLVI